MGAPLTNHLRAIQADHPCLGDVRGPGLMIGVEIVDEHRPPSRTGASPADGELARSLQRHCLECGVILKLGRRHGAVVRFLPPLIVDAAELDEIADRFRTALRAALAERASGARASATVPTGLAAE